MAPSADVGYYDPFNLFQFLQKALAAKLPLSNVNWRSPIDNKLKSFASLDVILSEEIPRSSSSVTSASLNDQYYHTVVNQLVAKKPNVVKLMLVAFHSMDEYRSKVRPLITEWLKSEVDNALIKPECIILHYIKEGQIDHSSFHQKLKTDFELLKIEKINYNYLNEQADIFSTNLKSAVLDGLTNYVGFYQKHLTSLRQASSVMNPMYQVIFQLAIIRSLANLNLFQECAVYYDHLDLLVSQMNETDLHLPSYSSSKHENVFEREQNSTDIIKLLISNQVSLIEFKLFVLSQTFHFLAHIRDIVDATSLAFGNTTDFCKRIRTFVLFLDDLDCHDQLSFQVLDDFLSSGLVQGQVDQCLGSPYNKISFRLIDLIGELKMMLKFQYVKLGRRHGFVPRTNLLPLKDSFRNEDPSPDFPDFQTFEARIIAFNQSIIDLFSHFGHRPRTRCLLVIEIATVAYHNKEYNRVHLLLQPLFKDESYLSLPMQEVYRIYVSGMEKMYLAGDSKISSSMLKTSYVELLRSCNCTESESAEMIEKMERLPAAEQKFDLADLFDFSIQPIIHNNEVDQYSVNLILDQKFKSGRKAFKIHHVKLVMRSRDKQDVLTFSFQESDKVKQAERVVSLYTNDCIEDLFNLETIEVDTAACSFNHSFQTFACWSQFQYEFVSPDIQNTIIDLRVPKEKILDRNTFCLWIKTGAQEFSGASAVFWSKNGGVLQLPHEENLLCKSRNSDSAIVFTTLKSEEGNLVFSTKDQLQKNQEFELLIPYTTKPGEEFETFLDVKAKVELTGENNCRFTKMIKRSLDNSLSISVSVQDIFKGLFLYSNFSVAATTMKQPVRIISTSLESETPKKLKISTPFEKQDMLALSDQPVAAVYKIEWVEKTDGREVKDMNLSIRYRDIQDEAVSCLLKEFANHLTDTRLMRYLVLLKPIMESLTLNLHAFALSQKIKVASSNIDFLRTFDYVDSKDKALLVKDLQQFFTVLTEGLTIELDKEAFNSLNKSLLIKVPVPVIQFIHKVELKFEAKQKFVVGVPVPMTLMIETVTFWSDEHPSKDESGLDDPVMSPNESTNKKSKRVLFKPELNNEFTVEFYSADNWLISGFNRVHHKVDLDATISQREPIEMQLIPLKVGKIKLPWVEVKPCQAGSEADFMMEVDYANSSEMVLVVSDLNRVTCSF